MNRATMAGGLAILLWSSLALLTVVTRGIPPFETLSISFAVAFVAGLLVLTARGHLGRLRQAKRPWIIGFCGLFFYHALYFTALDNAPPAQAALIAYLWPLLIVLFAALPPGEGLRARHVIGALMGLAGTIMILLGHGMTGQGSVLGYSCALAAAFVWAGYSVENRRIGMVPSELIAGVCGAVSLAALMVHLGVERTMMPRPIQWLALLALGLGPVGLAFYCWDHATKHGDLALLGTLSYAAPLLSTGLLIATGRTAATFTIAAAALLIVGGAVVSVGVRRQASRVRIRPAAR